MCPEDKVIYLDAAKGAARVTLQSAFEQFRLLAIRRLPAALAHMLDTADDTLFDRAERAESNQDQTSFFSAMRIVRLKRKELEEGFQRELLAGFRGLAPAASRAEELDDANLSLIDNEALEESIAIDSMIGKARSRNSTALTHLQMRLDHLAGARKIDADRNPIDPQQITRAFTKAAEILDIDISARLIFYKLFDKGVLGQLDEFYDEANQALVELGVLPNLKTPRVRNTSPAPKRPETPGAAPVTTTAASSASAPAHDAVFETLHQLLSTQKYGGNPAAASAPVGPQASAVDVVSALSRLQRDAEAAEPFDSEEDFKRLLAQMLRQGSGKAIGRAEDDTIDIVGMLFDAILGDPQLPASIKALIARLQIPVLKVALLDRSFFGSSEHPARKLINEMAQAALGWVEPAHLERDPLYRQIDAVVSRVLTEFDQNVDLFDNLLQDFLIFMEEERERARLIEERTRQAAEGKAKVDGAKARVENEIRQRIGGRPVPAVVQSLLDEAWSKVLFISYLKEGDNGEAWQRQLAVVDRLLWSIEPKATPAERKNLLVEIPGLLHDLREGLNGILFNPFEMTKLFKALEGEHIRCLAASGGAARAPQAEPAPAVVEPAPAAVVEEPVDDELAEYLGRLQDVAIGTWFEFVMANGNKVRAKLSARLSGGRRLIFVNRAGFKMADKALEDMARDLQRGSAQILDDNLLFDKALETVIANLRDLRAGQ